MNANNSARFLESPEQYFRGSYERFVKFGGPSVYFHHACLREANAAFLSERHIELLYATSADRVGYAQDGTSRGQADRVEAVL